MKVLRLLDKYFEEVVCTALLFVMTFCIFMQIIFRAVGAPLAWTEELARYLFVWLVYVSCSFAVRIQSHIKLDILTLLVKKRGKLVLDIFSDVIFFLFAVIIAYYGSQTVHKLFFVRPQISPGLKIPMWLPYLSVSLGSVMMAVRLVQSLVLRVTSYRKESNAELTVKGGDN